MSLWGIHSVGQLGNRLAAFAHLIAFGLETGRDVSFTTQACGPLHRILKTWRTIFLCRHLRSAGLGRIPACLLASTNLPKA
ncbi:MAG: hypothetical protein RIQ79_1378 [Verrucomicrobiota bacterium]